MIQGNRIIVENRSSVSDVDAMMMVRSVMQDGRVSNDGRQYCYATVFTFTAEDGAKRRVSVVAKQNKRSDRFVVDDEPAERCEAES